ncbi:MAG: diaminopimelate epimerase [Phycisphaerales bacterium JB039]
MRFVKMHGIGNDYIYFDAVTDPAVETGHDWPELARRLSDRHTGVGGDGVILVCRPGGEADARMRMFNADGSESEMCGNGVRCVAKFAHDRLGVAARPMRIETGRGALEIDYHTDGGRITTATVDMGEPILELERIPVRASALAWQRDHYCCLELRDGMAEIFTPVSMGNPHAVLFADENEALFLPGLAGLDLARLGPRIEHHAAFPRRVNAHFVSVQSPRELTMRTWERGSGVTLACGTGACAVLVAGVLTGRAERDALVHLPGGDLRINWRDSDNHVLMTGPATDVFEGIWKPDAAMTGAR